MIMIYIFICLYIYYYIFMHSSALFTILSQYYPTSLLFSTNCTITIYFYTAYIKHVIHHNNIIIVNYSDLIFIKQIMCVCHETTCMALG